MTEGTARSAATAPQDDTHALGSTLVVASAAFFGLAGVFTKSVESGPWTIACWRGLVGGLVVTAYVLWRDGAGKLSLDRRGWALVAVGALSSLAFIAAFKATYVANVAIIYATVPLMAAGLEWAFLRTRPAARTVATALVSLAGVGIIIGGGARIGNLTGDLAAVAMTAGCALYMVMIRAFRDTPVVWAGAVSAYMLFAAGWLFADPLDVSLADAWRMAAFGVTFGCAVILWTEGTRLIPAAESGVLGSAEVPFAILFAWIFLAELPPQASFAGGAVVIAAVLFHALGGRRLKAQAD